MDNQELLTRVIQVTELASDERKITVNEGKIKYSFWKDKKDGQPTKAYQDYDRIKFSINDFIEILYKEEAAEFTNDDGKFIQFTRRTILGIQESEGPATEPVGRSGGGQSTPVPQVDPDKYITKEEFEEKMNVMRDSFVTLANEVKELKGE